jgi:hypothetical protein
VHLVGFNYKNASLCTVMWMSNSPIENVTKIRPLGAELPYTNGQTDMTKLTVAFCSFADAHENVCECVCAGSCARARFVKTNQAVVFKNGTFKPECQWTWDKKKTQKYSLPSHFWSRQYSTNNLTHTHTNVFQEYKFKFEVIILCRHQASNWHIWHSSQL